MITLDMEQGTSEWFAARLGIPTASEAGKIITAGGKKSTQAGMYANKLIAEWLSGEPCTFNPTEWIERGKAMEEQARAFYEFQQDIEVYQVGFCYGDESRMWGCSPDGLIADDGMIEIKCPSPWYHVEYLLGGDKMPSTYVPQVQFSLMVTGREWCDFISYHDELPPAIVRVTPDTDYQKTLAEALAKFTSDLQTKRDKMIAMGFEPQQFKEAA